MGEPGWVEVQAPAVTLRGLSWEPRDAAAGAPIALCLHGFPDTAHGWRLLAPRLAAAGWRVVAPFMRGYAPSTLAAHGSYHVGAQMDDALRVLDGVGPTGRDVVIGHDWGAIAASGLAAMPDSPFRKAVVMSVPPSRAFWPRRGHGLRRSLLALLPAQAQALLVHDVLPTALAARAVQVVDPAAAVAAVVAGVRRERGPAPRRRGDRVAAELAGGAGPVPGDRTAR